MKKFAIIVLLILSAGLVAAPIRSNLGGDGEKYGEVEPYTAASYVQDGLFLMYDGIENVGWGEHDSSATTQADLGPYGLDFPIDLNRGYRVEDNALFVPMNYYTPRTINLTDDVNDVLFAAISNATITVEYVWEDLGSKAYASGMGQGTWSPIILIANRPIGGCRIGQFRSDIWQSGYGYYWGDTINLDGIQEGGSYSIVIGGLANDYTTYASVRWNDLYAEGPSPINSSTLHGTWASRAQSYYNTKKITVFPSNNLVTGRMYSIRVYTRALTLEEMAHNWNVDRERFGIGL